MSNSAPDNHDDSEPQIIRRKITLTEQHDNQLRTLADAHYGGNNSQYVRSAIEDHARTLDGAGETLLWEIEDDIGQVLEVVNRLQEGLLDAGSDSAIEPMKMENRTETAMSVEGDLMGNERMSEDTWRVNQKLLNVYPEGRSMNEIVSAVDLSVRDVKHALIDLTEDEEIESRKVDGTTRYVTATKEIK